MQSFPFPDFLPELPEMQEEIVSHLDVYTRDVLSRTCTLHLKRWPTPPLLLKKMHTIRHLAHHADPGYVEHYFKQWETTQLQNLTPNEGERFTSFFMGICMRGDLVLVERILLLYCGNEDMKHSSFPSGMIHWIDRQIYGSNNMAVIAYVNQRIPVVTRGALRTSTDHPIAYALSAPPDIEPNPDLLRSLFAEMDDWEAYQYLIIVGTMVDLCIQHRRIPTLLSYCEKDTRLKALLLGSSDLFNQVFRYYTGLAPAREPCVAVAKYYVNALYGLVAVLPVFPGLAHLAHSPIDSCEILFSARLIFFNDGDNLEQYVALSEEYKILKAAIQTYLT